MSTRLLFIERRAFSVDANKNFAKVGLFKYAVTFARCSHDGFNNPEDAIFLFIEHFLLLKRGNHHGN